MALPDTGCMATCMGVGQLSSLGIRIQDLLVPEMNLSPANSTGINIVGVTFLKLQGGKGAKARSTKQMVYVVKEMDQLLLSMEACKDLGIIGVEFPKVGSHGINEVQKVSVEEGVCQEDCELPTPCELASDGTCSCPERQLPPPPPEYIPGTPVHELKTIILNHYAASTFNRCTSQELPKMAGEELSISTRSDVEPVAVHKPYTVPKLWQDQVKDGLEKDVRMGIIEEVRVNTPTTWCSRMVCVPKHTGEPRRTVDFKALNDASDRQTHHTRSPFKMATDVPKNTKKSVLDIWNAYHSVPIREEDKHKTTFITETGRSGV